MKRFGKKGGVSERILTTFDQKEWGRSKGRMLFLWQGDKKERAKENWGGMPIKKGGL